MEEIKFRLLRKFSFLKGSYEIHMKFNSDGGRTFRLL